MSRTMKENGVALVTGAGGFLGRNLACALAKSGRPTRVFLRRPDPSWSSLGVEVSLGDLQDPESIRSACHGVETLFHVAAKVGVWGPDKEFEAVNVSGTHQVLDACRKEGVARLVYTSTPSVVYNGRDLQGVDESMPYGDEFPCAYPATKAVAEQEILRAHSSDKGRLKTTALRPHLIVGPGDTNLIPRILRRAKSGRLRQVGTGTNQVDLTYIDNAVQAHLLADVALASPGATAGGKAYFISNGQPVELWPWIQGLLEACGFPARLRQISLSRARLLGGILEQAWKCLRLSGEPPMTRFVADELAKDHWFSIDAARQDLAYSPAISMEEATRRTYSWAREWWRKETASS